MSAALSEIASDEMIANLEYAVQGGLRVGTGIADPPCTPAGCGRGEFGLDSADRGFQRRLFARNRQCRNPGILPAQFGNDDASSAFVELLTRGDVARGY